MSKLVKNKPQFIIKDGKPHAVIIDIKDYGAMLERLEDREDLDDLKKSRAGALQFRKFADFLSEYGHGV